MIFAIDAIIMAAVVAASYRPIEPDRERLVRTYLPLVRSLASRHAGRGESLDDLVQVASLALVTAARRFDPDRGVPFAAYAAPTIDGELRHHLRDRTAAVRIPRREQQAAARISETLGSVSQRLGREASLPEAADAAGVAVGDARRALETRCAPMPWIELESCPSAAADEAIVACELRAFVQAGLRHLDPREREAVRLRFVADLPQTEIGRRMDISQSQASRILAGALEKLRRELGPELDQAA